MLPFVTFVMFVALQSAAPADPHKGEYTRGLGTRCWLCHDSPRADSFYTSSQKMAAMVAGLNAGPLRSFDRITCFTCHRGGRNGTFTPPRFPRNLQTVIDRWPAALALPDADANKPARTIYRNLKLLGDQPVGTLKRTMSIFSASLGVSCYYCHTANDWSSDAKPAKQTTRAMIALLDEVPKYLGLAKAATVHCNVCHHGAVKVER